MFFFCFGLSKETAETKRLYGMEAAFEHTRTYAKQCLLARRLVENGVRVVSLTMPRAVDQRLVNTSQVRYQPGNEPKKSCDCKYHCPNPNDS